MGKKLSEQKEFEALNKEYLLYVTRLRRNWLRHNQVESKNVYEVMRPDERAKVEEKIPALAKYITPLTEAWWKQRGWGVIWPEGNSKTMQVYKLETAK